MRKLQLIKHFKNNFHQTKISERRNINILKTILTRQKHQKKEIFTRKIMKTDIVPLKIKHICRFLIDNYFYDFHDS